MRIIKLKNCQDSGSEDYCGQTINAGEYYQIQSEVERVKFASDQKVQNHLSSDPMKLLVNDGESDLNYVDGHNWLEGSHAQEVIPHAPKNEYGLRPYGITHKHIDASNYISTITLSNKSGMNIDYSGSETPEFYDCICQNDSQIRDGVLSVDGGTITTFNGVLENGSADLCKPIDIDYKIQTQEEVNLIYLWGVFFSAEGFGDDDIGRLQVCDPDGVGVTVGLYTQEQLEAMNYIIKEYDECWVRQISDIISIGPPNNTPAEVLNGYVLRVKYYPKDATKTNIKVWLDYKITIKDD